MSQPKHKLTIVRLADGSFHELNTKTKKLVCPKTEHFEYDANKTPFDLARYIKRAKQDRQRKLRHRGIPDVK